MKEQQQPTVEAVLIEDCLAPKRVSNSVNKKHFKRGERIRGKVTNIALTPENQVLALKTTEGYIVPEPFLNVLGAVEETQKDAYYEEIQDAEVVDDNSPISVQKAKAISKAFGDIKSSEIVAKNAVKSREAMNFALVGGALGLIFAMAKGHNKWVMATVGIVGGGWLGNYYANNIKQKNEKTAEQDD